MVCPECDGEVRWTHACHTYGFKADGTGGLACMNCDSAIEYVCADQYADYPRGDCAWTYIHGLNPRNPRSSANESRRPEWLAGHQLYSPPPLSMAQPLPGVKELWGEDDS